MKSTTFDLLWALWQRWHPRPQPLQPKWPAPVPADLPTDQQNQLNALARDLCELGSTHKMFGSTPGPCEMHRQRAYELLRRGWTREQEPPHEWPRTFAEACIAQAKAYR